MDEIPLGLPSVWLIPETRQQKSDGMVMQKDDNPPIWTIHCRSADLGHHPKIAAHFWPFALLLFSYRPRRTPRRVTGIFIIRASAAN